MKGVFLHSKTTSIAVKINHKKERLDAWLLDVTAVVDNNNNNKYMNTAEIHYNCNYFATTAPMFSHIIVNF